MSDSSAASGAMSGAMLGEGNGPKGGGGGAGGVVKPLCPGGQLTFKYVHNTSLVVAKASATPAVVDSEISCDTASTHRMCSFQCSI